MFLVEGLEMHVETRKYVPGFPFASYGPTGEISLLYHVHFTRYGPKPRT